MAHAGRKDRPRLTSDQAPTLEIALFAPAPIPAAAVVRDNRFIDTVEPKASQATFAFRDLDSQPGASSHYYVRVLIGADEVAWSSPLWVNRPGTKKAAVPARRTAAAQW